MNDLKERVKRTYNKPYTATPKVDDGIYEKGKDYLVSIDRMTCGKFNMYFNNGFQEGAEKSYRVFRSVESLEERFDVNGA